MELTTEKIKAMSFDKLYKLLAPTLREIGKEYSYISSSNTAIDNWLKKIVEEKYKKIMNVNFYLNVRFNKITELSLIIV